jgi:16S rRNA (uracil1498-N3)-methyltransferase
MVAALFYVDAVPEPGDSAVVGGDEGFHAATVRRFRPGETLAVADGQGAVADCVVEAAGRETLTVRVLDRRVVDAPRPPVTVVQAIPKSERSELAVELATEAGADAVLAWQAERCVARWDRERAERGLRRWRAVARSAARQSRRARVPAVGGPASTPEVCDLLGADGALGLVLHESADLALADLPVAQAHSIVLVVGPEGGVSDAELTALTAAGAAAVRLGPTVLRTSTAAAVALGALGVLTDRWSMAR